MLLDFRMRIKRKKNYSLEDEIEGNRGTHVKIEKTVFQKFREMVDTYIREKGIEKRMEELREDFKILEGEELNNYIQEYNKLLEDKRELTKVKDGALYMGSFPFSHKDEYGIYTIRIKKELKNTIYFKDIFSCAEGAHIENILFTGQVSWVLGIHIDFDEYKITIKNEQKGIECILGWCN